MIENLMSGFSDAMTNLPLVFAGLARQIYAQSGDLEKYTAVAIGLVVFVWILGSRQNRQIVDTQFKHIQAVLSSQFSAPGDKLVRESNSHYFVYSSGRLNCTGMSTSIHLSPREDFLARFLFRWIWPDSMYKPDRVEIEIFTSTIDEHVTGFLCRKFEAKKFTQQFPEIGKFCKSANQCIDGSCWARYNNGSSLTGFTYLADAGGKAVGGLVFGKNAIANVDSVSYLCVSAKSIRIALTRVPANWDEWEAIYGLALYGVLDVLAPLRVSEAVRTEVTVQRSADEQKRIAAQESEAREAALAKRQAEKRREQEEALKRMTPDGIRKMEEKERKRDMKKKAGKVMIM